MKPAMRDVLGDVSDALFWEHVYQAVTKSTPSPRRTATALLHTPSQAITGHLANSSEHRRYVDPVLKSELHPLYVAVPGLYERLIEGVNGVTKAAAALFKECTKVSHPLYRDGWTGWPQDAEQDKVLKWFSDLCEHFKTLANPPGRRRKVLQWPVALLNKPIQGSPAEHKLDIGYVDDPDAGEDAPCRWSQILVFGELKKNAKDNTFRHARLDLGRYAREVLVAQVTRRCVICFTFCRLFMRIWLFGRLDGIAFEEWDINEQGLRFVSTILAFLWMDMGELGFDPTFETDGDERICHHSAEWFDGETPHRPSNAARTLHIWQSDDLLEGLS
jgi:hypothetical protein